MKSIANEIKKSGLNKIKLQFYKKNILKSGIEKVNYLEVLNEKNLSEVDSKPCYARIFISVCISNIKLIDNLKIPKKIVLSLENLFYINLIF